MMNSFNEESARWRGVWAKVAIRLAMSLALALALLSSSCGASGEQREMIERLKRKAWFVARISSNNSLQVFDYSGGSRPVELSFHAPALETSRDLYAYVIYDAMEVRVRQPCGGEVAVIRLGEPGKLVARADLSASYETVAFALIQRSGETNASAIHGYMNVSNSSKTIVGEGYAYGGSKGVLVNRDKQMVVSIESQMTLHDLESKKTKRLWEGRFPAANADGSVLAFVNNQGIAVGDVNTLKTRQIYRSWSINGPIRVSPDGAYVLALENPVVRLPFMLQSAKVIAVASGEVITVTRPWIAERGERYLWVHEDLLLKCG